MKKIITLLILIALIFMPISYAFSYRDVSSTSSSMFSSFVSFLTGKYMDPSGSGTGSPNYCYDIDNDGYYGGGTVGCVGEGGDKSGDCNDNNNNINPGKPEICGDLIDNDCDGKKDEGCESGDLPDPDIDDDGVINSLDNCPTQPNSGQEDNEHDGFGDVCDSNDDGDGYGDTSDNCPLITNPDQRDNDHDGYGAVCECDDNNQFVNPSESEICDKKDNDCDSKIDEGFDKDGDGISTCGGDCNDNNRRVYPGATDAPDDGIDADCDGEDPKEDSEYDYGDEWGDFFGDDNEDGEDEFADTQKDTTKRNKDAQSQEDDFSDLFGEDYVQEGDDQNGIFEPGVSQQIISGNDNDPVSPQLISEVISNVQNIELTFTLVKKQLEALHDYNKKKDKVARVLDLKSKIAVAEKIILTSEETSKKFDGQYLTKGELRSIIRAYINSVRLDLEKF